MKELNQYYTPDPLEKVIDDLSDPRLCFEGDRKDVNELVLNLVMKYAARYLRSDSTDPHAIEEDLRKQTRVGQEDFVAMFLQITQAPDEAGFHNDSDKFALQCLADIRATAAIVKEIIFEDRYQSNGEFIGLDFGSGTGILTLASVIAARRNEQINSIHCLGFENARTAVIRSRDALYPLFRSEVEIIGANILNSRGSMSGPPLQHWVSETISHMTPPLILTKNRVMMQLEGESLSVWEGDLIDGFMDPYGKILDITIRRRPEFRGDVNHERTAMFPNLLNGSYRPNGNESTLLLRTSASKTQVPLSEIGGEFADYEDFRLTQRWHLSSPEEQREKEEVLAEALGLSAILK